MLETILPIRACSGQQSPQIQRQHAAVALKKPRKKAGAEGKGMCIKRVEKHLPTCDTHIGEYIDTSKIF